MPQFDRCNIDELKDFLYYGHFHDAKLECITYQQSENTLKVKTFNPIFSTTMDMSFYDVGLVFAINGDEIGSRETIISLTVEDDFPFFQKFIPKQSENLENSLYLLFQMFSGDELHIVSKKVVIDIVR